MFGTTVGPDCCPGRGKSRDPRPACVPDEVGNGAPQAFGDLHESGRHRSGPPISEEASPLRLSIRRDFGRSDLDSSRSASPARYWSFRANVVSREISSAPASPIRHAGLRGGFSTSPRLRRDSGRSDRWSVEIASSRPMEVIPSDRVPRQPSRMRWERTRPSSLWAALGAVARAGGHASSTSTLRGA